MIGQRELAIALTAVCLGLGSIPAPAVAAETPGPGKPIVSPKKVRPVRPPGGKPLTREECERLGCKPQVAEEGYCQNEGQIVGVECVCTDPDGRVWGICIDEAEPSR